MLVVMNPAGPVHTVLTSTSTFTVVLNTTVQDRVTSDPTGWMGLTGSLVMVTDVGRETRGHNRESEYMVYTMQCYEILLMITTSSSSVSVMLFTMTSQVYCPASDSLRGEKESISVV